MWRLPHATAFVLASVLTAANAAPEPGSTPQAKPTEADREGETATGATDSKPDETQSPAPSATAPKEPPPSLSIEEARGPDVTLIAGEERTVYEYRQHGKLRMIKVVPDVGKPYFLVPRDPTQGFGDLEQAGTLVPRWVLIEF